MQEHNLHITHTHGSKRINSPRPISNGVKKLTLLFLTIVFIFPALSLANGGDQRVVDAKYLINLSRAPFTPRIGVKTSFLASFIDIQKPESPEKDDSSFLIAIISALIGGIAGLLIGRKIRTSP